LRREGRGGDVTVDTVEFVEGHKDVQKYKFGVEKAKSGDQEAE